MNKYPDWVPKYIEICSNPLNTLNKSQIAEVCNIRRETIFRYFQTNRDKEIDIERIIYDNLKAQKHILGSLGIQQLVKSLNSKKVSMKAIQMALTVSGDYVESHENVNRFANMKDSELDGAISNLLRKAQNERIKEDIKEDIQEDI